MMASRLRPSSSAEIDSGGPVHEAPKRVIVLAFHFPPDVEVGAIRPGRLVQALVRAGHTVDVITARLPGESGGTRVAGERLTVHAVDWWANPRHWIQAVRDRVLRWVGRRPAAHAREWSRMTEESPGRLRRLLRALLWLPDENQGYIVPAVRKAVSLIRYRGADVLFSTEPPFSVALAGLLIKHAMGIPWVMEYRDPWTDIARYDSSRRTARVDRFERWLEDRCLDAADAFVAVTPRIAGLLGRRLAGRKGVPLTTALNGINEISTPPPLNGQGPIRILHAGSLYGQRNPAPFLEALARVRRDGLLPVRGVSVEFLGADDAPELQDLVDTLHLGDLIRVSPRVQPADVGPLLAESHLLLLMARHQPAQIPNKLYDYLGVQRPIIGFVDAEGESRELLEEAGGHFLITSNDCAEAAGVLHRALRAASQGWSGSDPAVLENWRTDRQLRLVVDLIGAVADSPR